MRLSATIGLPRRDSTTRPDTALKHNLSCLQKSLNDNNKRLYFAVLERAILDAILAPPKYNTNAINWFRNNVEGATISFEEVCNILDVEPEYIIRLLKDEGVRI